MAFVIQTNFTTGELSPRLDSRVDFDKYQNGCQVLENFLIHPHGGASRRPGLRFIAQARDAAVRGRLLAFQFSTSQAYILEWGEKSMRVFKDGGQVVLDAEDATEWATATDYVAGDMRKNGDQDVVYRCTADHTSSSATEPGAGEDWAEKWTQDPTYEIATPYSASELDGLGYCQSADVMYLVHQDHPPMKLSRTGHTNWSIEAVEFTSPPEEWTEGNYPALVMFYEQRLCFAGAPDQPQSIWMSKSGSYHDFGVSETLVDSDACSFTLVSNQVNAIRWMVPAKRLLLGTSGAEFELGGSGSDAVTPFNVNAQRHTTVGSKDLDPVAVGNIVLYAQRNGRRLREFAYSYEVDGYISGDLTLLAEHLTKHAQLGPMTYQQDPDSVVWCARSDGQLLGLSYMREQKVYAWHRHPTLGRVESVATIPGDGQDELWCLVRRTIGGSVVRYVERLDQLFSDNSSVDAFFLDAGLTYDGRNDDPEKAMTLAADSGWSSGETGTLTATGHTPFSEESVGQAYILQDPDAIFPDDPVERAAFVREAGTPQIDIAKGKYKVRVLSLTSSSVVQVSFEAAIPATLQDVATPAWSRPVNDLSGMGHLAGATVAILADGSVLPSDTVSGSGGMTISREASVVHVGLAYTSKLQSMNLDLPAPNGTSQGRIKKMKSLRLRLYKTLGGQAGPDFSATSLTPLLIRTSADPMGLAPALFSGDYELSVDAGYDEVARICVLQDQPLPMTVLAYICEVDVTEA